MKNAKGFTLIEMLVVIAVMTILAALVFGAVQGVIGQAQSSATKTTINKISRILEDSTDAFNRDIARMNRQAGDDRHPKYVNAWHRRLASDRTALARILAKKDEYRKNFQQTFAEDDEIVDVDPDPNNAVWRVQLNWPHRDPNVPVPEDVNRNGILDPGEDRNGNGRLDITEDANFNGILDIDQGEDLNGNGRLDFHTLETENAECLYQIVTHPYAGAAPISEDAFSAAEVQDTDGDGLMEFVDSWGNPLRFYRWPTRMIRRNDGSFPAGFRQAIINPNEPDEMDRQYRFKIDETIAGITFGPLSPRPRETEGANPQFTSRYHPGTRPSDPEPTLRGEFLDALARDPDDLLGLTHRSANSNTVGSPPLFNYDLPLSPVNFESRFHTPSTYFRPLIISAGPDEELGIHEPDEGALVVSTPPQNAAFGDKVYQDTNFGRLAQPILGQAADDDRQDNISSAFLRPGKAR